MTKKSSSSCRRRGTTIKNLVQAEVRLEHLVDSAVVGIVGGIIYDLWKLTVQDHVLSWVGHLVAGVVR